MFIGEYQHTMDNKGRINVPAKFREILGASFVMTKGLVTNGSDGCICIYHKDDWNKIEEKFRGTSMSDKERRRLIRYIFSCTAECEPDNLGRVNIPPVLREHAGLKKEVVTIGAYDRVEIWDKERWEAENGALDDEEIALKMRAFGI